MSWLENLKTASQLSDLRADRRLDAKLDLSPEGVRARLLEASQLLDACDELSRWGAQSRRSRSR